MFYDYHMHSNFSNDSKADMEDMIKRSIDLGLKETCRWNFDLLKKFALQIMLITTLIQMIALE